MNSSCHKDNTRASCVLTNASRYLQKEKTSKNAPATATNAKPTSNQYCLKKFKGSLLFSYGKTNHFLMERAKRRCPFADEKLMRASPFLCISLTCACLNWHGHSSHTYAGVSEKAITLLTSSLSERTEQQLWASPDQHACRSEHWQERRNEPRSPTEQRQRWSE